MSTYSLPRLLGGGGMSANNKINFKFGTLRLSKSFRDREKRSKSVARTEGIYDSRKRPNDLYHMLPIPAVNRHRNRFRGARKEEMDQQANLLIHSMTVGNSLFIYHQFNNYFL